VEELSPPSSLVLALAAAGDAANRQFALVVSLEKALGALH